MGSGVQDGFARSLGCILMSSATQALSSFHSAFVSTRGMLQDFKGPPQFHTPKGPGTEKRPHPGFLLSVIGKKLSSCTICVGSGLCMSSEGREGNGCRAGIQECLS